MSGWFLLLPCFIEISVFNANSVDPDQTPLSAASDLGLHCLPMSLFRDARHKWVKHTKADVWRKMVARSNKYIEKKLVQKLINYKNSPYNVDPFIPLFALMLLMTMGIHITCLIPKHTE